ncbi:hypothetical protein OAN06_02900 [Hellea sp.]|nr:hypothetical protein [Hellea sp.]
MEHKTKNETKNETKKEKVYTISVHTHFYAEIPVLGVDEKDARRNLLGRYGYREYDFIRKCREEGWCHGGEIGPECEIEEGNQDLHDYLFQKRISSSDYHLFKRRQYDKGYISSEELYRTLGEVA